MSNTMVLSAEPADAPVMERPAVSRAVEQCLADTVAIRPCSRCGEHFLIAHDEGAERRAIERAVHLWKAGLRGFQGLTEREVVAAVRSALGGYPERCPHS